MSLDLRQIQYLSGHPSLEECPADQGCEVAFAGRSNVGKSSVINALCERRGVARTSAEPGRTRLLHFFELDAERRLVDLPGYGFARVSRQERARWQSMVEGYLAHRKSLVRLMLIMDIRHPLKDSDQLLLQWCQAQELPVHLLLNKADKLSRSKAQEVLKMIQQKCNAPVSLISARTRDGLADIQQALRHYLQDIPA